MNPVKKILGNDPSKDREQQVNNDIDLVKAKIQQEKEWYQKNYWYI